jgi:hypothetical protein
MDNLHSHMSFSVTLVGSRGWIITIKPGEHTYDRKVLTASKKFIVDEVHFCPNHPSKNMRVRPLRYVKYAVMLSVMVIFSMQIIDIIMKSTDRDAK